MNMIPLNTFDQVAAHYAAVKPMRGKHKDDNVRPIDKRSRAWERIVKMDEDTYLLTDPHYGDPVFSFWGAQHVAKVITREEQINLAPIVWRRHPDGTETVTVRNATGGWGQHNARYSFLHDFLPEGLVFCMNRSGDHYIARALPPNYYYRAPDPAAYGDKYYLSISTTVPQHVMDDVKATAKLHPHSWQVGMLKWATETDDGAALTFKRESGCTWSYTGGGRPRTVELPRVMTDLKASFKEKIAAFFDYCFVMRPLLEISHQQQRKLNEELQEWQIATKCTWPTWGSMTRHMPAEIAREVINPEHPMYLHFAYALMYEQMQSIPTTKEDLAKMKAGMNRWINKTLGFITLVVEERK